MIPVELVDSLRGDADALANRPVSRAGAVAVVAIWLALAGFAALAIARN
jgi:hypothetical protein